MDILINARVVGLTENKTNLKNNRTLPVLVNLPIAIKQY